MSKILKSLNLSMRISNFVLKIFCYDYKLAGSSGLACQNVFGLDVKVHFVQSR